jgi:serine/threonine protein kinase
VADKTPPERIGPYRILGMVGVGGMSSVYRARRDDQNVDIALKVLSEERVQKSPVFLGRFQREVAAMIELKHPHIVTIYDAGESGGHYYLAMELMEGQSLKERVAKGPMNAEELTRLAREMLSALSYCHAQGVLHRDLKPTNIFVLADGMSKLLDFGLAKRTADEPLTAMGKRIGTPRYMAPEVVRGSPPDHRADIYQLGLLLYEAAAGRAAFTDSDVMTVLRKVVTEEPPNLSFFNPALATAYVNWVRNCIHKLPEKRYQSCAEVAADLDVAAAGGTITLRF